MAQEDLDTAGEFVITRAQQIGDRIYYEAMNPLTHELILLHQFGPNIFSPDNERCLIASDSHGQVIARVSLSELSEENEQEK